MADDRKNRMKRLLDESNALRKRSRELFQEHLKIKQQHDDVVKRYKTLHEELERLRTPPGGVEELLETMKKLRETSRALGEHQQRLWAHHEQLKKEMAEANKKAHSR